MESDEDVMQLMLWHSKNSSIVLELTKRLVELERRVRELELK